MANLLPAVIDRRYSKTSPVLFHDDRDVVNGVKQAIAGNGAQHVDTRDFEAGLSCGYERFSITSNASRRTESNRAGAAVLNPANRQPLRALCLIRVALS